MPKYAVINAGSVVGERDIPDINSYPAHKVAARDEKGDGGPVLRLIETEGSGEIKTRIVELDRVRDVFSERPLDEIKADLARQIDDAAENVRLRYITPGAGMAMTYQEKFAQAQAVDALGEESANALSEQDRVGQFPTLSASVGIEAATLWDCAQLVISKYEQWAALSNVIETARLAGKKSISDASTAAEARAAYQAVTWPSP